MKEFPSTPEFLALRRRYLAGIRAVRKGADPVLVLYHVLWPSPDIEEASRGELPPGWRFLTERELWEREREHYRQRWQQHQWASRQRRVVT